VYTRQVSAAARLGRGVISSILRNLYAAIFSLQRPVILLKNRGIAAGLFY
jgi:hypothetical protein